MKKILLGVVIGLLLPLVVLFLRASPTVEKFQNVVLLRHLATELRSVASREGEFPAEINLEAHALQASKRRVADRFIKAYRSGNVRYDPARGRGLFRREGERWVLSDRDDGRILIEWTAGGSRYTCRVDGMVLVDGHPGLN